MTRLPNGRPDAAQHRLQGRHQLRRAQRLCRVQGDGPLHRRIDLVIQPQHRPQHLRHDLPNIGIGKVQRILPATQINRLAGIGTWPVAKDHDRPVGLGLLDRPVDARGCKLIRQ
jgi:hypothetical protein